MNVLKHNRSIVFIMLTFLLSNSALAVTYSCKKFGKTFSTTLPGYSSGGFSVLNSSCGTLIDKHWNSFGMEKKYYWDGVDPPVSPLEKGGHKLNFISKAGGI